MMGDYAGSERALRQAVAIYERQPTMGYDFGITLSNLASVLRIHGLATDAEPFARRAVEVVRATAGDPHMYLGAARNELAEVLCAEGRYSEAPEQARASITMFDKLGSPTHPLTAQAGRSWGSSRLASAGRARANPTFVSR